MMIVTGYNVIGYFAAPISMGALKPKTRLFGLIVFILCGFVLVTLPLGDLVLVNLSLTGLMAVFVLMQLKTKQKRLTLLSFTLPFLAYLWLTCISTNLFYIGIILRIFYSFVTNPKYIAWCRKYQTSDLANLEEFNNIDFHDDHDLILQCKKI